MSVASAQHVRNARVAVREVEKVNAATTANVAEKVSHSAGCLGPGGAHCRSSSDKLCWLSIESVLHSERRSSTLREFDDAHFGQVIAPGFPSLMMSRSAPLWNAPVLPLLAAELGTDCRCLRNDLVRGSDGNLLP